jgi:glyoxylase-like metal-dependent hydrolase (beta-lactamase superfamily II)/ferredoxin
LANITLTHPENVAGDFFVDTSCIDCDLCRQIAPEVFSSAGAQSVVHHQPHSATEEGAALRALVTCPTASIGALGEHPVAEAVAAFPELVEDEVDFCGFASPDSFGASSYLIRRLDGNVLIDVPRFNRPLARRIEELGGVRWICLTHRDDIADHDRWSGHFGATRVMHRDDARGVRGIEQVLEGHDEVSITDRLLAIPTPGHTKGHMVFLARDRFLFTGDHVWGDEGQLWASKGVCWYSWPEQIRSMERLRDYRFSWVLPGHGRRFSAPEPQMRRALDACIARMKKR